MNLSSPLSFLSSLLLLLDQPRRDLSLILHWGMADAEIKVTPVQNPELTNVLPLNPEKVRI